MTDCRSVLISALLAGAIFTSCGQTPHETDFSYSYTLHPESVTVRPQDGSGLEWRMEWDRPESAEERSFVHNGLLLRVAIENQGLLGVSKQINEQWVFERVGFWFGIENMTADPISLLWAEASYVDEHGGTHKIAHCRVNTNDSSFGNFKSVDRVQAGEFVLEAVYPAIKVHPGVSRSADIYHGWPLIPLNIAHSGSPSDSPRANWNDTRIGLLIPIRSRDGTFVYNVTFVLKERGA